MRRLYFTLISTLIISSLAACSDNSNNSDNSERMAEAEKLFVKNCSGCHGADGMGKPYREIPANLMTSKSKADIIRQIMEGSEHKKQVKMRAMTHLSADQAALIADYMVFRQKQK